MMSASDYFSRCCKVGCHGSDTVFYRQRPSLCTVCIVPRAWLRWLEAVLLDRWTTTRATEASQASEAEELKAFDMQTNSKSSEATPKMLAVLCLVRCMSAGETEHHRHCRGLAEFPWICDAGVLRERPLPSKGTHEKVNEGGPSVGKGFLRGVIASNGAWKCHQERQPAESVSSRENQQ